MYLRPYVVPVYPSQAKTPHASVNRKLSRRTRERRRSSAREVDTYHIRPLWHPWMHPRSFRWWLDFSSRCPLAGFVESEGCSRWRHSTTLAKPRPYPAEKGHVVELVGKSRKVLTSTRITLSLSNLVSSILFSFLDSGLFWALSAAASAILNQRRGSAQQNVECRCHYQWAHNLVRGSGPKRALDEHSRVEYALVDDQPGSGRWLVWGVHAFRTLYEAICNNLFEESTGWRRTRENFRQKRTSLDAQSTTHC